MKVIHLKKEKDPAAETAAEIKELQAIIKVHPANTKAHNRLMILYRKQRNYTRELQTINRAIKIFKEIFDKRRRVHSSKVKTLSAALAKATGLSDNKGKPVYEPGDLRKWNRRKELVSKKIKAQ